MRVKTNFILLAIFIFQLALGTILPFLFPEGTSVYFQLYITQIIPIMLPILLYCLIYKNGFSKIRRSESFAPIDAVLCIILAICLNIIVNKFISNPIFNIMQRIGIEKSNTISTNGGFELFVNIIILCVIPAVAEETLFRGYVLTKYEKIYGSKNGILMCGLMFALMHASIMNIVPQFVIGAALSFIVFKTNSLYMGILSHFVMNLFTVMIQYSQNRDGLIYTLFYGKYSFAMTIIIIFLFIISLLGIIIRHKNIHMKKYDQTSYEIRTENNFFILMILLFISIELLSVL